MSRKKEKKEKKGPNFVVKALVVLLFLTCVGIVINFAPNFVRNEVTDKINLIINNGNVTTSLKYDIFVENDIVYISTKDIANFFDENIYYDNQYDLIITSSSTKLGVLPLEENELQINGTKTKIKGKATKKDGQFYLPFSELNTLYNIEVEYIKDNNVVTVDSLNREQKRANVSKDVYLKFKPTDISKNLEKLTKGESVIVVEENSNGWYKVRTKRGTLGYVNCLANCYVVREKFDEQKQIEGKVSLVWDYFYSTAPDRTGTTITGINVVAPTFVNLGEWCKGEPTIHVGTSGEKYIDWAHENNYKVWAMVSNDSHIQTTSEILNDYKLREKLINNLVDFANKYNVDGLNIDFENMYEKDKDVFTRFLIELAPRLKECGKVLSVDVTAPDGSPEWSLCYDRNAIGKVADYIIFMGYDQHGLTSQEVGTTAGADWVEVNIKKFIGTQEEVNPEKLILGMPFFARLWTENGTKIYNEAYLIKQLNGIIPSTATKEWNEDLKQYYVTYQKNGKTYEIWLEDEKSIGAKCDLVNKYNLAGGAYWSKDGETKDVLNTISEKFNIK